MTITSRRKALSCFCSERGPMSPLGATRLLTCLPMALADPRVIALDILGPTERAKLLRAHPARWRTGLNRRLARRSFFILPDGQALLLLPVLLQRHPRVSHASDLQ